MTEPRSGEGATALESPRRRAATERLKAPATKAPLDPEQERIKQERLEKIRKAQEEKKKALLAQRAAAGAPPSAPAPTPPSAASAESGSVESSADDVVVGSDEDAAAAAAAARGRSLSSPAKRTSNSSTVRAAGRAARPSVVPVKARAPVAPVSPAPSPNQSSLGDMLSELEDLNVEDDRPSPRGASSGGRVKRVSGAQTPELTLTPELSRPPRPAAQPVSALANKLPLYTGTPEKGGSGGSSLEDSKTAINSSSSSGGAGGSGWGFFSSVVKSVDSLWGAGGQSGAPSSSSPRAPPPTAVPITPPAGASLTSVPSISSSPRAVGAAVENPLMSRSSGPGLSSSSSIPANINGGRGARDSAARLHVEEMADMQDSLESLRLMVARQGALIRKQDELIEELQKRLGFVEQVLQDRGLASFGQEDDVIN